MNTDVKTFLRSITDSVKQADSLRLAQIMHEETGETAKMWGTAIVGFGTQHYKYASGREGDTVMVGFSPRKQALTLYGVIFYDRGRKMLDQLGKYTTGKGCLYIKQLSDVDEVVLRKMIKMAYEHKSVSGNL